MFKRYELHNHTTESDALITCEELIEKMAADGVDCFALTDHNTISGHRIIRKYLQEKELPLQCAYGMEYTTYFGHIVCPILHTYVPWDSIDRRHPERLFAACKAAGGITGIAHPFSYGAPFAQGCRFEMELSDFSHVDYIEVINNPELLHEVNAPAIRWWEELVLSGIRVSACAGMDLHKPETPMAMRFATYAMGEAGGDAIDELRTALAKQQTWVSKGMLLDWAVEGDRIRFTLCDLHKPGFIPPSRYTMTLTNANGTRTFDLTAGSLTLSLSQLGEIEIPKLYGDDTVLDNLICIAPVIYQTKH